MEALGILLLIGVLVLVVVLALVLPIRAAIKSSAALEKASEAQGGIRDLTASLAQLREKVRELETIASRGTAASSNSRPSEFAPPAAMTERPVSSEKVGAAEQAGETRQTVAQPEIVEAQRPVNPPPEAARSAAVPPPLPVQQAQPPLAKPKADAPKQPQPAASAFTLEQFMGVKLFAWVGGLALFLGLVFFVKHAFQSGWIEPPVRTAIGFVTGIAVMAGGVIMHRHKNYIVLAQTLCATGTLVLYGVTFAAHTLYKFPAFGTATTFLLMSLITVAAFLLAVRLNALVVAILGMLGGFLTPVLVSTGEDHPFGLFGYIALLDAGLLAVAKQRRWLFLAALAAAGTLLMEFAWFGEFFHRGHYAEGARTLIPMGIFSFFVLLFLAATWWSKQRDGEDLFPAGATIGLCGGAMLFAFIFLAYGGIAARPGLLYGFVLLINIAVLATIAIEPKLSLAQFVTAGLTFLHLALWTDQQLKPELLVTALVCYLGFGLVHSAFPVIWQRLRPQAARQSPLSVWVAPLALVLLLMPVLQLEQVSFTIWPAILLLDVLIIALAAVTSALAPVLAAIAITLLAAMFWLFKLPAEITCLPQFLTVLGGFAVILTAAGCWLAKRYLPTDASGQRVIRSSDDYVAASLPVFAAGLPFLLLIMAVQRLPIENPSPVFGLALLLVVVLLALAKIGKQPVLTVVALAAVLALEFSWHSLRFNAAHPWIPLLWYAGIGSLFAIYPFVFRASFRDAVIPWAAAALSGIGHFLPVYDAIKRGFPNEMMGLVPLVFAIPPLASLLAVQRSQDSAAARVRLNQLAWFGGAALFFITLIFPIQFERQWITLGWALEGAALIWLFNRVPHHGLRLVGVGLLAAAFVRLALNPAVLTYQVRSGMPFLNWHLYTYSIAAAALVAGARWLRPPNECIGDVNVQTVLFSMGGILLFLLVNIEIADYFTEPGRKFIAFKFSGDFARDMTYSIAWAVFALALIVLGFSLRAKGARYAGVGLLAVTLFKLFFHDLAAIGNVYRIAALIVVAVIALSASFLYQRFYSQEEKS